MSDVTGTFVNGVVEAVFKNAVKATEQLLASPPGRNPDKRLAALSDWYLDLGPDDQEKARNLIALSSDQAIFGFLAGLDGSRLLISPSEADGVCVAVTTPDGLVLLEDQSLHEEYRSFVDPMGELLS